MRKIYTDPPKEFCDGCEERHREFFWHCADEITWGSIATCTKCGTMINPEKETPMVIRIQN